MKKLLTFLTLLTLSIGVTLAAEITDTWTATQGALGGSGSGQYGTITTASGKTWNYERNKTVYTAWQNGCIQLGSGSGAENITFYTSVYGTATIKSVSVECSSYNAAHNVSISVGGTTYLAPTPTDKWTTVGTKTGTGNSSGEIEIKFTDGTRAMYIKSISVTYDDGGGSTPTTYSLTLPTGLTGGTVTASATSNITSGTSITITATPNTGYELSNLTVDDNDVTSSVNSSYQYTFSMPAHDVAVSATFTEQSVTPTTSTQYSLINNETDLLAAISAGKKFVIYSPDVEAASKAYNNSILPATSTGLSYDATNKILTVANNDVETYTITATETSGAYKFQQNSDNTYISVSYGNNTNIYNSNSNVYVFFYGDYAQLKGSSSFTTSGANARALSIETVSGGFKNFSGPGKETPTTTQYKLPGLYAEAVTGDLTVTCADNLEHGSITASPTTANENATITITATPEAGYELSTVTVTPESGTAFQATVSGNTATFTMPASSVTVTATFTKVWNAIGTNVLPTNCGGEVWVYSGQDFNGVKKAQIGDDIYFRVVTDQNNSYQLESLTITDADNNTITYVDDPSDSGWKWEDGRYGAKFKFVMPATAVTIKVTYKRGDLYILGTVNETASWHYTNGPQLTYDGTKYSIDVYFKGADENDKFGYFSFTTKGNASSWDDLYGARIGSADGDQTVINSDYPEKNLGWNANAFKIPAGIYNIEVAADFSKVTITPKVVTVTLDKSAGEIEAGTTVNVVSNINTLLQACNSSISGTLAYSTNDGSSYTEGNSFVVNSNMTAKGKAYYGYIEAESNSYAYNVVTHYAVTATANPAKGGTISVSPTNALEGETVTITANPKNGYELTSITVNGDELTLVEGQTEYTFTMPAQATEVVANFTAKTLHLTINNDNSKGTVYGVPATSTVGSEISFTVTPKDGYTVNTVTYSFTPTGGTENTTTLTAPYRFNMPGYDVTIDITYTEQSSGSGGDATDLYHESFGNNNGSARDWDDNYSVKTGVADVYSGITGYTVSNVKQGKNTTGYVESGLNQSSTSEEASIIIGPLNVANYTDLVLSYQWKAGSLKETYYTNLSYATSADGTYTEVEGTGDGATTFVERSYNLPELAQVSTLYLKIVYSTSNTQAIIDEVNLAGVPLGIQDPVFTPAQGIYGIDVDVTISCSTSGATIYYTDDNSDPKTSSTRKTYTGEIVVSETTTFKAYAEKDGLSSDVVTATYTINKNTEIETVQLDYLESFTGSDGIGKFTIINESGYSPVWSLDGNYGVKGTAYNPNTTPTNNAAVSRLVSPIIDLTAANVPELTFSHQINSYFNNPSSQCQVFIRETTDGTSGTWVQLPVTVTVPASGSWSNDFARIDLSNYIDKKIQISFLYTNPEAGSGAGTWEIQNFKVADNTDIIIVNNIADFMANVEQGDEAKFRNPVVVLYHYQQYYNDEHGDYENDYIWVKDNSGYAIIYGHYLDVEYVNGDVIPAGFTATKNYYSTGKFDQLYEPEGLKPATEKALADPEPVTLTKLNENNTAYNGHYVTISKMQIQFNKGKLVAWSSSSAGQRNFSVGDETLAIADNQSGSTSCKITGYNNFDNPWLETLDYPEYENATKVYGDFNITGIFEQYNNNWEFMPIIITPWEAQKVTLHDLCVKGVTTAGQNEYTISNNLLGVYSYYDEDLDTDILWVKDDNGQSIHMVSPEAPYTDNFAIEFEDLLDNNDNVVIPANTRLEQQYYDQSNWCQLILTGKNGSSFVNKIINGGAIKGNFVDKTNPTMENVSLNPETDIYSTSSYAPNYYIPASFVGSQSCATDMYGEEGHGDFFFMTPKPQEYATVVWAVWDGQKMNMPTKQQGNSHELSGEFSINLSMNQFGTSALPAGVYSFHAIIRKVNTSGAPALKEQGDIQNDQSANYMVYPLDIDPENNPSTAINTVDVNGKTVKSVKFYNVAGIESATPFQGVNIVVTEYTDGSRTTTKMLRK